MQKLRNLIRRASCENELAVGIEGQAIDLGSVGINQVARLGGGIGPGVPYHKFLIVSNRSKQGLMQQVPGHILYNSRVAGKNCFSIHNFALLWSCINIPQTDSMVIRCT